MSASEHGQTVSRKLRGHCGCSVGARLEGCKNQWPCYCKSIHPPTFKELVTLVPVNKSFEVEERSRVLLDSSCNEELMKTERHKRCKKKRDLPVVASREIFQASSLNDLTYTSI